MDVPGAGACGRRIRRSHPPSHRGLRRGRADCDTRGVHGDRLGAQEGILRRTRLLPVPARAGARGLPSAAQGRDEGGELHVPALGRERRAVRRPGGGGTAPPGASASGARSGVPDSSSTTPSRR